MSPQTGSFVGLTFTAISRAQQFEILLGALWNVQRIFESNFSIIVLTHFCSLTGMMFVDVSNIGGVGFVQEVYYRRQDVCNLYGDVGWLRHYLSGPAQCNIWELNSAVHSKTYIEEIRFFWWEITCVPLHCHLLFVETIAPLAIRSWPSLLLCWWSSRVRQN